MHTYEKLCQAPNLPSLPSRIEALPCPAPLLLLFKGRCVLRITQMTCNIVLPLPAGRSAKDVWWREVYNGSWLSEQVFCVWQALLCLADALE